MSAAASSIAAMEPGPPDHVAIIMDGNGRWARARGLPRIAGHRAGAEAVRRTLKACAELGISYLTLYAFSSENWKRPESEVSDLMGLLTFHIRQELAELKKNGVRIRFVGDRGRLSTDIVEAIDRAERETAGNDGLSLVVALNYGGRDEVTRAVRQLAAAAAAGTLDPAAIDDAAIAARLDTAGIPDPDLVIRTSGEQRLSNFLLWQAAYAELFFTATPWPDFGRDDLVEAIGEYQRRERRYGAVSA